MEQQTLTLILGALIALASSVITGIVNHRLSTAQAKREYEAKRREENIRLKWEEVKRDVEATEQLIEAINLVIREQFHLAQVQLGLQQHKANDEIRKNLEQRYQEAINRIALYGEQQRQVYARTVWRVFSLPQDVQNSFMAFDKAVGSFFQITQTGGNLDIMEVNKLGGTLRTTLREYLASAREEITSMRTRQ